MTTNNPSLSVENIKRLTDAHITRFENRVRAGEDPDHAMHENVNLAECRKYLEIWQGIREKNHDWAKLDSVEKGEVFDALDDE